MATKWIDVRETAKLVRAVLRESFPGMKFRVRISRYAGGCSMRVAWTDGPTVALVEELIGPFEGRGFDGMQDLSYFVDSTLDGEPVNFGGAYLFCERELSDDLIQRSIDAQIARGYALPDAPWAAPTVENFRAGRLLSSYPAGSGFGSGFAWNELIYHDASKRMSSRWLPRPSATRDRVGYAAKPDAPAEAVARLAEVIPFPAPATVQ